MVPKLLSAGKSFKGLSRYLTHDAGAATKERVAWTHTLNLAHDDPGLAVDEMLWTYRAAEMLKHAAGARAGGRRLQNSAKHFSLNWHPSEEPSRAHMIETVQEFLAHMGWQEHQALLVCHNDRHPHVHVMVNAVHPETGRALDSGFEKRRAQEWAFAYEHKHARIFCEERLLPTEEREPSPTREAWLKMKTAEHEHDLAEAARSVRTPEYFERHDSNVSNTREWDFLKSMQRAEREGFFAGGKEAYREVRNALFREVRTEFRAEWKAYYQAMRKGGDQERLAGIKKDILSRQNAELESRRDPACAHLREMRDADYRQILLEQKMQRGELASRQSHGLRSYHLLDSDFSDRFREETLGGPSRQSEVAKERGGSSGQFVGAAEEVCTPTPELAPERHQATEFGRDDEGGARERHRVRDPIDVTSGLSLGAFGALAGIGERLLDGFLGGGEAKPAPKQRQAPAREMEPPRTPAANQNAAAAEEERLHEIEALHAYWEDRDRRRGRARDR